MEPDILSGSPRIVEFREIRKEGTSIEETSKLMRISERTAKYYDRIIRQPESYLETRDMRRSRRRVGWIIEMRKRIESGLDEEGVFISESSPGPTILLRRIILDFGRGEDLAEFPRNRKCLSALSGRIIAYTDPQQAVKKLAELFDKKQVMERALRFYSPRGFGVALAGGIKTAFCHRPEVGKELWSVLWEEKIRHIWNGLQSTEAKKT